MPGRRTLQSIDLVAQPLVLRLRLTQLAGQLLNEIEQSLDQLAGLFFQDGAQVNVLKYAGFSVPECPFSLPRFFEMIPFTFEKSVNSRYNKLISNW